MRYKSFTKSELIYLLEHDNRYIIKSPQDIEGLLLPYATKPQEHFIVITLNGKHELINHHVVTIGLVNRTMVHPREVFRPAILDNAVAIIVAHNHPSGSLEPSAEDKDMTKRLAQASEIIGIQLLDHIIIGKGFYSFREHNQL